MHHYLLVSLHDVAPSHLDRMARAEALFTRLGVPHVCYLYVPRFHRGPDAADDLRFVEWCAARRSFTVQWFLHGYYHDDDARRATLGWRARLARRLLTSEAEFLALPAGEADDRLRAGLASLRRAVGVVPDGFVAPGWLWRPELAALLAERGFRYTEDHLVLHDLRNARSVPAPAITWATRTLLRRIGSRVVCPELARRWAGRPVLRLAVHPFDFDHPATVHSIERVLARLMEIRSVIGVEQRCFDQ